MALMDGETFAREYDLGGDVDMEALELREESMKALIVDETGDDLQTHEENCRRSGFYDCCAQAYENCPGAKIKDQFTNVCSQNNEAKYQCSRVESIK